jgi:hypothetical protein
MKNYFLFIARQPILFGFWLGLILLVPIYFMLRDYFLFLSLPAIVGVILINYWVVKQKITVPPNGKDKLVLAHYPDEIKKVKSPFWGKIPLSIITMLNDYWDADTNSCDTIDVILKHRQGLVEVALTLTMDVYASGLSNIEELQKYLRINNPNNEKWQYFSLEDRLRENFISINQTFTSNADEDLIKWMDKSISKRKLSRSLLVNFRSLSSIPTNIKKIEIRLKKLSFAKVSSYGE